MKTLLLGSVIAALAATGCPRDAGDNGATEPTIVPDDAAGASSGEGATSAPAVEGERVAIAASDAAARNLPAVGFSVVLAQGMGMLATPFPDQLTYLTVSGPPGGPLFLLVQPWSVGESDDALPAEDEMRRRFTSESDPYAWHGESTVAVAGEERQAFAFEIGASLAQTLWCAAIVPPPAGGATGVLLAAAIPAMGVEPSCESVASHPAMAPMLASFVYE